MNAQTIIASAMKEIAVLPSGEVPSAAESADCFLYLNNMIDEWTTERLMIFTVARQIFPLTVGQQVYTLGTGGNFNIPRPTRVERAGIINLSNPAQPLELPLEYLTFDQWAEIPVKNIQSALPQKVWNDNGFPLMNLSYWCVPTQSVQTALYCWSMLTAFPDLVTDEEFPPGYANALIFGLAVNIGDMFGRPAPPSVIAKALTAKARVKTINAPLIDLHVDAALVAKGRHYNWRSDLYQ